jgi:hypothetical protein
MTKGKAIALILVCSVITLLLKLKKTPVIENRFVVENSVVDKSPYINLINSMFEESVESNKACDCLLTKYYQLIKSDSSTRERFKKSGMIQLDTPYVEAYNQIFAKCVIENTIDTSYKLKIKTVFKNIFTRELKSELANYAEFKDVNQDSTINCLIDKLDQKITIREYYEQNEETTSKFKNEFKNCLLQNAKK